MQFDVLHVHNETEQNSVCDFVECTDQPNGDVLLIFRCRHCQIEVAVQIKNKKES